MGAVCYRQPAHEQLEQVGQHELLRAFVVRVGRVKHLITMRRQTPRSASKPRDRCGSHVEEVRRDEELSDELGELGAHFAQPRRHRLRVHHLTARWQTNRSDSPASNE